jgi:hypothetical protein
MNGTVIRTRERSGSTAVASLPKVLMMLKM